MSNRLQWVAAWRRGAEGISQSGQFDQHPHPRGRDCFCIHFIHGDQASVTPAVHLLASMPRRCHRVLGQKDYLPTTQEVRSMSVTVFSVGQFLRCGLPKIRDSILTMEPHAMSEADCPRLCRRLSL